MQITSWIFYSRIYRYHKYSFQTAPSVAGISEWYKSKAAQIYKLVPALCKTLKQTQSSDLDSKES